MPSSFKNQNTGDAKRIEKFKPPIRHEAKKVVIPGDDMSDMFKEPQYRKKLSNQKSEKSVIDRSTLQIKAVRKRNKKKKPNALLAIIPKQISPELAVMLEYITDYVTLDELPNNQYLTFNQVIKSLVEYKIKSISDYKASDYRSTVSKALDNFPDDLSDSEMRKFIKDKEYKKIKK